MNIIEYRKNFPDCVNGFLVTGTVKPELDKKNRTLLKRSQTGHWRMKAGRIQIGDAMFILLPSKTGIRGYPRELHGGRITAVKLDAKQDAYIFSVDHFERFQDIESNIKAFLGGHFPPPGNTILSAWEGHRPLEETRIDFEDQVTAARLLSREQRLARIALAASKPLAKVRTTVEVFVRNPDIVATVLEDAKGVCAACGKPAPFQRAKDGSPYLEVHHQLPLAEGGKDILENAQAICPNCHREKHLGKNFAKEREVWAASRLQTRSLEV